MTDLEEDVEEGDGAGVSALSEGGGAAEKFMDLFLDDLFNDGGGFGSGFAGFARDEHHLDKVMGKALALCQLKDFVTWK